MALKIFNAVNTGVEIGFTTAASVSFSCIYLYQTGDFLDTHSTLPQLGASQMNAENGTGDEELQ